MHPQRASAPGSSSSSWGTLNRHKLTVSGERGWLGDASCPRCAQILPWLLVVLVYRFPNPFWEWHPDFPKGTSCSEFWIQEVSTGQVLSPGSRPRQSAYLIRQLSAALLTRRRPGPHPVSHTLRSTPSTPAHHPHPHTAHTRTPPTPAHRPHPHTIHTRTPPTPAHRPHPHTARAPRTERQTARF